MRSPGGRGGSGVQASIRVGCLVVRLFWVVVEREPASELVEERRIISGAQRLRSPPPIAPHTRACSPAASDP